MSYRLERPIWMSQIVISMGSIFKYWKSEPMFENDI